MYIKRLRSDSLGRRSPFFSTFAAGQQHPCFKHVFEGPCGGAGTRTCGRESGCRSIGGDLHVCICRFDGLEIRPDLSCDKTERNQAAPDPGCFKPAAASDSRTGETTSKFVVQSEGAMTNIHAPDVAIVKVVSPPTGHGEIDRATGASTSLKDEQLHPLHSDSIRLNFSGFVPYHEPAGKTIRLPPQTSSSSPSTHEMLIGATVAASVLIILLAVFSRWKFKKHRSRRGMPMQRSPERSPDALETLIGRGTIVPNLTYDEGPSSLPELPLGALGGHVRPSTLSTTAALQLANIKYLSEKEITLEKEIGEGCFGKVFRGTYQPLCVGEPMTVAVKKLKQSSFGPSDADDHDNELVHEADIIAGFSHKNILTLIGLVRPASLTESFWMVVEYLPHGDLVTLLRKSSKAFATAEEPTFTFSSIDLHRMAAQVASGMEYLAHQHYIHRDLACRNCLVGENLLVKISDFGLARDIYCCDYYRVNRSKVLPVRWMSPESIIYGKFSLASDVWAFGVVLWEIYSFGKQPYYGRTSEEAFRLILDGVLLPVPEKTPHYVADIMKQSWRTEPSNRTNFAQIVRILKVNDPSRDPSNHANASKVHPRPEVGIGSADVTSDIAANPSSSIGADCGYLQPISSSGTSATYLDLMSDPPSTTIDCDP